MKCDLHIHSNYSDGLYSPQQLVRQAYQCGLSCIAITDHDTLAGVHLARTEGDRLGVQVLSGVELSTMYQGREVHILVYGLDYTDQSLIAEMNGIYNMRTQRNQQLAECLARQGMPIDMSIVNSSGNSVGRPAIAREMVRLGYVSSVREAFDLYIGNGKPCHVQAKRLTPLQAIELSNRYGGVSVLAHPSKPIISRTDNKHLISTLVSYGLHGIESHYFSHTNKERKYFAMLANQHHLIMTGGSDYHDSTHGIQLGQGSMLPDDKTIEALGIK